MRGWSLGLLASGLVACSDFGNERELFLTVRVRQFPFPIFITDSFGDGKKIIAGTPDVLGITGSFDTTPFDSIAITFTVSFSVFPPVDWEEPYSIYVRRYEPPNEMVYSTIPTSGVSEHTATIGLVDGQAVSFSVGANSHAPVNAVVVTISSLSIYGWSR